MKTEDPTVWQLVLIPLAAVIAFAIAIWDTERATKRLNQRYRYPTAEGQRNYTKFVDLLLSPDDNLLPVDTEGANNAGSPATREMP